MLPNANYSSHVDLSEELFFQLEPLEYFLHPFLLLHPWPLLLGPSNVEVKPKTYRSKKWDSWKLWILSTELMTNLERWMGPNCKSDLWFSYMLLQVYWFLLKDLHLFLQLWVLQYNALSLCVFALVTKILMPSPQIHTFLTHLAILWALSGSETLHIVGQPSVNAQALTLENCLDAVGMDVSNSGCVSRKGSRQMQREEHANKCWKAAGCQMWAYRAWCFKKCWNVLLYSNFLCFEIFFFFWSCDGTGDCSDDELGEKHSLSAVLNLRKFWNLNNFLLGKLSVPIMFQKNCRDSLPVQFLSFPAYKIESW